MRVDINLLNDVVNELNLQIYELHGEQQYQFGFISNGSTQLITYGEVILWNNMDDNRDYNEDEDEYEDLLLFVKRKFNEYTESLQKLRF